MKIGILADSHDHVVNLKKAITFFNAEKVELIYHCGDWVSPFVFEFLYWECKPEAPVKGVFGNNEGDRFRIVERISTHKLPVVIRQHTLAEEVDDKILHAAFVPFGDLVDVNLPILDRLPVPWA